MLITANNKKIKRISSNFIEEMKLSEGYSVANAYARSKFNRISMSKVSMVARRVKRMPYKEAMGILQHLPNKSARIIEKTLKSAAFNLMSNEDAYTEDDIYVSLIYANEGPTLKRIKPRARGRADRINKRTSHLTVHVVGIVKAE